MKNKTLIVLVLLFAVLMAGAYGLYSYFSTGVEVESLMTTDQTASVPPRAYPDPVPPGEEDPVPTEEPKQTENLSFAPDFVVYDKDGEEVRLSDFVGKPVILNFWATWCGYCKMHMPVFEEAFQTYGEDIHFVMINLTDGNRETVESASSYIEDTGYSFPVYYDTSYSAAMAYGATSIPVTYFIDADGHGIVYGKGPMDAETLQAGIDIIYTPQ